MHYNLFKYSFKNSSKCLEMSVDAYNSTLCKNPLVFFEKLRESSSSSFCFILVICTATLFYFALVPMSFFLLVDHPAKPLSPGEWTHWRILSSCNKSFFFLSKTESLQKLALASFWFCPYDLAIITYIQGDPDLEFLATPRVA